jgi:hypothetical protein
MKTQTENYARKIDEFGHDQSDPHTRVVLDKVVIFFQVLRLVFRAVGSGRMFAEPTFAEC